ncbi:putative potassium voltage-gated channel subfamily G member 2-like, partial [Triplophysa rosa]
MYQEVAFLAGSTDHQFTSFHFNPLENPHEISSKKGVFYKRAQLQQKPGRQEDDVCHHRAGGVEEGATVAIINVGGIRYRIPWSTLEEFPLTRLGKLRSCSNAEEILDVCDDYDARCNEFFFDRSPSAFRSIVTFLAAGKLRLLREMCALSFQEELLYWGVEEASLEWCCLRKLRLRQEEQRERVRLEEEDAELTSPPSCEEVLGTGNQEKGRLAGCMHSLRDMVENPHSGIPGKIFACLSVVFVAITAVTLCVSTMPDLREEEERVSV